jgi:hypothetical protein
LGLLFNKKSTRALAPRGFLQSAYVFLCLICNKKVQGTAKGPKAILACGWVGLAFLTKTMKSPQRHGAGVDPPIIFCACSSMKNAPGGSEMPQGDFRIKKEVLPPTKTSFGGFVTPPPHAKT